MLDVIYLATTVALFAIIGLITTGIGRLGTRAPVSAQRDATREQERA